MPLTLIVLTLILLFGLLSYYLILSCLNLPHNLPKQKDKVVGVSLIICAKNEIENLQNHLPIWLKQRGIEFEFIVVNDGSSDGSKEFLEDLKEKTDKLKVLHLENNSKRSLKGKRHALLKGVEHASYDYIVLSDADCYPTSENHLLSMSMYFAEGIDIVLGYSPYEKKPGILNKMIQFETTLTAIQYLSFARVGFPYMGVGRNLAYRKKVLFEEVFMASNVSLGGDDDLMIAELANKTNTAISINPESHVFSIPPISFSEWMKQKHRHYSTGKYYKGLKMMAVGGLGTLTFLFYIMMFILLLVDINPLIVLGLYLSKLIMFVMFNYRNFKVLKNIEILYQVVFLDVFWILFLVFNHLKALKGNNGWS